MALKEVVLPNGKFAALARKVMWSDIVTSYDENLAVMCSAIVIRTVTLDGQPITVEELMAMDLENVVPLLGLIREDVEKAMINKDGVK